LTYISSAGDHEKGSEISDSHRYTSMLQNTFVNQRNVNDRKVADIVGVVPKKTIYTEVILPIRPIKINVHKSLDLSMLIPTLITKLWDSESLT